VKHWSRTSYTDSTKLQRIGTKLTPRAEQNICLSKQKCFANPPASITISSIIPEQCNHTSDDKQEQKAVEQAVQCAFGMLTTPEECADGGATSSPTE
jgi:hypothetical protein